MIRTTKKNIRERYGDKIIAVRDCNSSLEGATQIFTRREFTASTPASTSLTMWRLSLATARLAWMLSIAPLICLNAKPQSLIGTNVRDVMR